MDSTTEIKSLVEPLVKSLIDESLKVQPGNGFGVALATILVACGLVIAAAVFLAMYSRKQTDRHIASLNSRIKEMHLSEKKVQELTARLDEHKASNADRLFKLQIEEIDKRDATRTTIIDFMDKRFGALQDSFNSRLAGVELRIGDCEDGIHHLDKAVVVIQSKNDNKPS